MELRLGDVNDNRPMWETETFLATLPEDSVLGSIVTKVHAIDLDLADNRKITYSLHHADSDNFAVDSRTGIVSLSKSLDREVRESYNLSVRAMDSGRPRLSAVTNLIVRVLGESQWILVNKTIATYWYPLSSLPSLPNNLLSDAF